MNIKFLFENPQYILLFAIALIALLVIVILLLKKINMSKDYSKKRIRYYIRNQDGVDYLIVPYLFWQMGKLKEIKNRFSEYIEIDNTTYKIGIQYDNQKHIKKVNDIFPQFFYKDFVAKISLYDRDKAVVNKNNISTNINNTFINGNNNQVNIYQNQITEITNTISRLIYEHSNEMTETDKQTLELFLYRIRDNTAKKDDAKKVIDVLTGFLPLTAAIIELIKSIFF